MDLGFSSPTKQNLERTATVVTIGRKEKWRTEEKKELLGTMSMPLLKVFGKQEFGDWVDDVRGCIGLVVCSRFFAFHCFRYIYYTCVESRQLNANEYWVKLTE